MSADATLAEAHRWLDAALAKLDLGAVSLKEIDGSADALHRAVRAEDPSFQIAVLKACVERLPVLRLRDGHEAYVAGSALYSLACALYGDRLPYAERDVCDLLRTADHTCGHGADVQAPFDAAVAHARRFGVTADLLEAARQFIDGLAGVTSSQASHLKRRAAVFFLLDRQIRKGEPKCWSHRVRTGLAEVPPTECARWHALVLQMAVHEQSRMPDNWREVSEEFLNAVGAEQALTRFEEWWPDDTKPVWPLQGGGSQFLKHSVWMLGVIRNRCPAAAARCDQLAIRLASVEWKPRERAKKVLVVVAHDLAARPPEVGWEALRRLVVWSRSVKRKDWEPDRILDVAAEFARGHGLGLPE